MSSLGADLRVEGLGKSFGSRQALADVSFTVPGGRVFGFVGSNGAGKTTAMRIIMGVVAKDSGRVTLGDHDLDMDLRRQLGYMPEERGLYPKMKVGEHLIYLARLHGMSSALARESMMRWTERLGIAERLSDSVEKLSLGNQQRVQLASALIFNPAALVLDEPFSGLDPVAVDTMSQVLHEQAAQGVPVIFSSHQLDLVERLSDRVGIISEGKMVAQGSVSELRASAPQQFILVCDLAAAQAAAQAAKSLELSVEQTVQAEGLYCLVHNVDADSPTAQQVLQAAVQAGRVSRFTAVEPSLVDMFRQVVSSDAHPGGAK